MKTHQEKQVRVLNGWMMLVCQILMPFIFVALFNYSLPAKGSGQTHPDWLPFILAILLFIFFVVSMAGFFTLQPNEARVLILFGKYVGTVKESGFHWGNPFYSNGPTGMVVQPETGTPSPKAGQRPKISRFKVSSRVRTLNGEKLKVNDKRGSPIEIAAVVVWRVEDTAQAMLRRQQAEAVIAARQKIVHGAVSMVEMALKDLADKHVVQLDDKRRAAMVSNLMVVLCGESEVHPVINTGTLYS